jgi:hypothetical protein
VALPERRRKRLRRRRGGNQIPVQQSWTPPLEVSSVAGRCRLHLGRYAHGNGDTLQDAGDDLVSRLLSLALCFRSGFTTSTELPPPDLRWLNFVYEVGDIAARGGDVRERIFGSRGTP